MRIYSDELKTIEGFLVSEFRTAQALFNLVQEERLALFRSDVNRLLELSQQKESLLNRMESLTSLRARLFKGLELGTNGLPADMPGVLQTYQAIDTTRLMRLQQGVLVLMSQTREIVRGNRSIANRAILQMASLSATVAEDKTPDLPVLLSALMGAYDVLSNQEDTALPAAMEHLDIALEQFALMLDQSARQSVDRAASIQGNVPSLQPAHLAGRKLAEGVTRLFRRRSAYQAVLESSSRMLANASQ